MQTLSHPKNEKGPLPKDSVYGFQARELIVAVLGMKWESGGDLTFGVSHLDRILGDPVTEAQARDKAIEVADPSFDPGEPIARPTPWDIPVCQQSYLVLVLHPRIRNWAFWGAGVHSKGDADAYDFNPQWLETGGKKPKDRPIRQDERPRVLYFSVGRRGAYAPHNIDLYVKIFDTNSDREMPLIFDPDVPNTGVAFP